MKVIKGKVKGLHFSLGRPHRVSRLFFSSVGFYFFALRGRRGNMKDPRKGCFFDVRIPLVCGFLLFSCYILFLLS